MTEAQQQRGGLMLAIGAFSIWGLLPLYFHLLVGVPALQVLAHRVVWSVVLLAVALVALGRVRSVVQAARGRTLLLLVASSALIAVNWLVYIWAVQAGHVLEASLGYFINPLVNVALGIAILGERLRRMQGVALGIAGIGVLVLASQGGALIGISLALAISFGFYGLIRKVAAIDALGGLTVETVILAPAALAWLGFAASHGASGFGLSLRTDLLLLAAGVITTTPLLLFAGAARQLPLSLIGLLQYIAPTLQFVVALVLGEPLRPVHIVTFALIWSGCAIFAWDSWRATRPPAA